MTRREMRSSGGAYWCCCALVLGAASLVVQADAAANQRLFTVDDLLRLETILTPLMNGVTFSPDGERFAYVRCLPKVAHPRNTKLCSDAATEVWLAGADGRPPVKLSVGNATSVSRPMWSSDGKFLAVVAANVALSLESKSDERSIWVWERATGQVRKVADQVAGLGELVGDPALSWVDSRTLVVITRTGKRPHETWLGEIEPREWLKAAGGREPTANVLDSGGPEPPEPPRVQAILVDVTGKVQAVESTTGRALGRLVPAPKGNYVALLKPVRGPSIGKQATLVDREMGEGTALAARHQLGIVQVAAARCLWAPRELFVKPGSVRWLPSGNGVIFAGAEDGDVPATLYKATLNGDRLDVEHVGKLEPTTIVPGGQGDVLVRASSSALDRTSDRQEWWRLTADGRLVMVTDRQSVVPESLIPAPGGRSFVGVAGGQLWRLDIDKMEWTALPMPEGARVESLAWPFRFAHANGTPESRVVVVSRGTAYYRFDLNRGQGERMATPPNDAQLVGYEPEHDTRVFLDTGRNGGALSLMRGGRSQTLVAFNGFLKDVVEGEIRQIEYRSTDGQALTGVLILPARYEPGRKYPLVTWVYQGQMAGALLTRIFHAYTMNLQMFAASGYAVLVPSMPNGSGTNQDPYLELSKGALPAVDKVIDLGIADPQKLAVAGLSNGGFSVYGLITQTNRFRAAIALAGPSNYVSAYGTLSGTRRYRENAHETLYQTSFGEDRFNGTLWRDLWRYMRNSPLFYVDRVQTPTLIVQGDFDPVPMMQGEEFFTALYRQGKRARFVRYLGEGHSIESPANIRDLWKQITQWLAECFADAGSADRQTARK